MVEWSGFENRRSLTVALGSNPRPSAKRVVRRRCARGGRSGPADMETSVSESSLTPGDPIWHRLRFQPPARVGPEPWDVAPGGATDA